jgi:hypothetical protein
MDCAVIGDDRFHALDSPDSAIEMATIQHSVEVGASLRNSTFQIKRTKSMARSHSRRARWTSRHRSATETAC